MYPSLPEGPPCWGRQTWYQTKSGCCGKIRLEGDPVWLTSLSCVEIFWLAQSSASELLFAYCLSAVFSHRPRTRTTLLPARAANHGVRRTPEEAPCHSRFRIWHLGVFRLTPSLHPPCCSLPHNAPESWLHEKLAGEAGVCRILDF